MTTSTRNFSYAGLVGAFDFHRLSKTLLELLIQLRVVGVLGRPIAVAIISGSCCRMRHSKGKDGDASSIILVSIQMVS